MFLYLYNSFNLSYFFAAEADKQALITGRATEENLPSKLMQHISKMVSEISNLFSNGLEGLFRDAKENDEETTTTVDEKEEDDKQNDDKERKDMYEGK